MKFRLGEWQIILAAYAYEVLDSPHMTDFLFDKCCESVAKTGTTIPNFNQSTGQWIHDVLLIIPEDDIKKMCIELNKLGDGASCKHVVPKNNIHISPGEII